VYSKGVLAAMQERKGSIDKRQGGVSGALYTIRDIVLHLSLPPHEYFSFKVNISQQLCSGLYCEEAVDTRNSQGMYKQE
jgi:hypothetical protein